MEKKLHIQYMFHLKKLFLEEVHKCFQYKIRRGFGFNHTIKKNRKKKVPRLTRNSVNRGSDNRGSTVFCVNSERSILFS